MPEEEEKGGTAEAEEVVGQGQGEEKEAAENGMQKEEGAEQGQEQKGEGEGGGGSEAEGEVVPNVGKQERKSNSSRNDAATPKRHTSKAELSPIRSQQSLSPHSREGSTGYLQYSARGGKFSVSNPKSDVEWKILRAAQVPGPGSYGAAPLRMGGGKFSTCKPKSDTDWIVLRASQIPAPGQYKLPDTTLVSGGKFSQSRPKTSLDWAIYNGKKTPGPGQYDPDVGYKLRGGKFSEARPKTDVDWVIYKAERIPGPGQYELGGGPGTKGGGKFSTARPKTDVDWKIYRASKLPGPGQYSLELPNRVSGGRLSTSKTLTDVDVAIMRAKQTPGPGEYNHDINALHHRTANSPVRPNPSTEKYTKPLHLTTIPPEARGKPRKQPAPLSPQPGQKHKPRSSTAMGVRPDEGDGLDKGRHKERGGGLSGPHKPRPRSASPTRWYVSEEAAKAYGVSAEDYKKKERNKHAGKGSSGITPSKKKREKNLAGKSASSGGGASPSPSPMRVHVAASQSSNRAHNVEGDVVGAGRGGAGGELSDKAKQLFDLAMGSDEFKTMMRLYTGLENPEEVIQKYATLWSDNAMTEGGGDQSQSRGVGGGQVEGGGVER